MSVYYLLGWHGNLNAGDDAFAIVTDWGLRKYARATDIVMESDISNNINKKYHIKLIQNSKLYIPGLARLRRKYYFAITKAFVYAGGSLFNNKEVDLILKSPMFLNPQISKISLGVSVGPFISSQHEQDTVEVLKRMNYVSFRDNFSYKWAKSHQLDVPYTQAFDMAILLPMAISEKLNSSKKETQNIEKSPTIGISLLAFNYLKDKTNLNQDLKWVRELAKATNEIASSKKFKIILYSFCRHPLYNDDIVCQAFMDAISSSDNIKIFKHNGDPNRILTDMKKCSHIISMRLHGSIFAYTNKTPLLMLNYHSKCRDFAETIDMDQKFCLDLENFDIQTYKTTLHQFLETKKIAANLLHESAVQKALLNFEGYNNWI